METNTQHTALGIDPYWAEVDRHGDYYVVWANAAGTATITLNCGEYGVDVLGADGCFADAGWHSTEAEALAAAEPSTTTHPDIDVFAAVDMFQTAAACGLTRRYHGFITNGDPAEAGTLFIDEFGVITVALAADDIEFDGIESANVKIGIAYPGFFAWLNDWVTS